MKRLFTLLIAILVAGAGIGIADLSFVGHGWVVMDEGGGTTNWYSLDDSNPSMFDTNNTTGEAFSRTFTLTEGDELRMGGETRTWDGVGGPWGSGTTGAGSELGWRVTTNRTTGTESWNVLDLPWFSIDGADDKWQQCDHAFMTDVVSGLSVGTYYLEIYQHAWTNTTEVWRNEADQGGNDWEAEIVIEGIPEPGSLIMLGLGLFGLMFARRRRRQVQ